MLKRLYKNATLPLAASATLIFGTVSPVLAGDRDAPASSPSTVITESFPQVDLTGHNPALVDSWVKRGCPDTKTNTNKCEDRVALVSYGGEDGYSNAILQAAKRLDRESIPVAFIRAADNDDNSDNVTVSAYSLGKHQNGFESSSEYTYFDESYAERNGIEDMAYNLAEDVYDTTLKPIVLSAR